MKGNTRRRFALGGTKAAVWGLSVLTLVFGMSLALAGCGGDDGGDDDKKNVTDPNKVATPTASPVAGAYSSAQNVTLTCDTADADIYYTTNGDTPTTSSTKYTTGISVSATTTIKAIAVKDGMTNSDVLTAAYTITGGDPGTGDKTYAIGDTGPGGGTIFYVSTDGFTVYQDASDTTGVTCHYLEAAPANISGVKKWASTGMQNTDIPGTGTEIGTGRKNTALITAADSDVTIAAYLCKTSTDGGQNDWFLPSKAELNELYNQRDSVGDLGSTVFWSSSQHTNNNSAKNQRFSDGYQGSYFKYYSYSVRAVRAF